MNIKVNFQDGFSGGTLTTDHSQSSYGLPVFVADDRWPCGPLVAGAAYGSGDLRSASPLEPDQHITLAELDACRRAGFRVGGWFVRDLDPTCKY